MEAGAHVRRPVHTRRMKKHAQGHAQPRRPLDAQAACCSSSSASKAGDRNPAPAAKVKGSSSLGKQHGHTKALTGSMTGTSHLISLNLGVFTHNSDSDMYRRGSP